MLEVLLIYFIFAIEVTIKTLRGEYSECLFIVYMLTPILIVYVMEVWFAGRYKVRGIKMGRGISSRLVDKNEVEVFEGDLVNIELNNGKCSVFYKGIVRLNEGEFRVEDLKDLKYGEPYITYPEHNYIPLKLLLEVISKEYISNYGEVERKSNKLECVEVI